MNPQPADKPDAELASAASTEIAASEKHKRREILIALGILCSIVVVSLIWYQARLGFYSDDWWFLASMHFADQSFSGVFHALDENANMRVRPVQVGTLVLLYKLFHLAPFGYHIFNAAVLVSMALLLFLLLLELQRSVLLSASVAALFVLLPNCSTDRFWVASFQVNVSIAFYLLSFYSDLKSLRRSWIWKAISLLSTAISIFAYEVALPLFAINMGVLVWKGRGSRRARWTASLTAAVLAVCLVVKVLINERAHALSHSWLNYVLWIYQRAFVVHFYQYGVALPHIVFKIIRNHLHSGALAVALIAGLLVAILLSRLVRNNPESISQIDWKKVIGAGLVVFVLGYAIFVAVPQIGFSKTGVNNRAAIAAALGAAVCYVGVIGWFSSFFKAKLRKWMFCALIATLCAAETLITNSIAYYWAKGYQKELAIHNSIFAAFPYLPSGTAVIIDGVCPYYGPAEVLVAFWDTSGILQLHYDDPKLAGDVISPRIQVENSGLLTSIYGTKRFYPYAPNLLIYNVKLHKRFVIRDRKALQDYLKTYRPETNLNCPGHPGDGVAVF